MRYLNDQDMERMSPPWADMIEVIRNTVHIIHKEDYAQPIKPYLRYHNPQNRIIAMPAYVGGDLHIAGLKWISSFPGNIQRNIPRAHSVVVLNEADTGIPLCIFNTPLVSIIRTCSVSGLVMKEYTEARRAGKIHVGIIGWGPIGRNHYAMCMAEFGDRIEHVYIYDIAMDHIKDKLPDHKNVTVCGSWEEVFAQSDVLITCTVSSERYIDQKPKPGSLLLNVSLRDYKASILNYTNAIIVDDWNEVCRENTDIEYLHLQKGLNQSDVRTLEDVVCGGYFHTVAPEAPLFFNPMGMAAFDIAIAKTLYDKSIASQIGVEL